MKKFDFYNNQFIIRPRAVTRQNMWRGRKKDSFHIELKFFEGRLKPCWENEGGYKTSNNWLAAELLSNECRAVSIVSYNCGLPSLASARMWVI